MFALDAVSLAVAVPVPSGTSVNAQIQSMYATANVMLTQYMTENPNADVSSVVALQKLAQSSMSMYDVQNFYNAVDSLGNMSTINYPSPNSLTVTPVTLTPTVTPTVVAPTVTPTVVAPTVAPTVIAPTVNQPLTSSGSLVPTNFEIQPWMYVVGGIILLMMMRR